MINQIKTFEIWLQEKQDLIQLGWPIKSNYLTIENFLLEIKEEKNRLTKEVKLILDDILEDNLTENKLVELQEVIVKIKINNKKEVIQIYKI